MAILIGVDEAGYGPNLGPLVIGFSTWRVPSVDIDLYDLLKDAVCTQPKPGRLAICDSKKMGGGICGLETAVFASLTAMQLGLPASWYDHGRFRMCLPDRLPTETTEQLGLDWCDDADGFEIDSTDPTAWNCEQIPLDLPVECRLEQAALLGARLRETTRTNRAELLGTGVLLVHPWQFNQMLQRHGNKSRLLGVATMHVAGQALGLSNSTEQIRVICDRQGGRQRYSSLLRTSFDDHNVNILSETPECSSYRLVTKPDRESVTPDDFQIEFQVGGESNLPVALASMHAKYVRELAMLQWNRFWRTRIDGIHPTAGYPVDAARFRNDLRRHVTEREMPDQLFWRAK